MDSFSFKEVKDLRRSQACVRNTIKYEINERLAIIKKALNDYLPIFPAWDKEDNAIKVRRRASSYKGIIASGSQESRTR